MEKLVPDTSIIIEGLVSKKIESNELKVEEILIHEAILAELEHQANQGRSIGLLGLDELKKIRDLSEQGKFQLRFAGRRPGAAEIRHASLGEIDSLIRELAYDEGATLLTGDKVQSKVGEAKGVKVIYVQPEIKPKKLTIDKYFDNTTMSVHLRENIYPYAKKGFPGNWKFTVLSQELLKQEEIIEISKEIIEEAKIRTDGFIETERRGSTIVQLGDYRIVITRPPFSDAWEITCVKPIKKTVLEDYELSEKLRSRIEKQAEGILIAGSPGHGKSTFASALAEFYVSKEKTVKTIEAPRDLQLSENVTQYSISYGSSQEIHDVLLLSRPDYTIFDEMRNIEDFRLFADLRLAGIGLAGIIHANDPIDAIQRFIGKTELGLIPHIIDTVIFIKNGHVNKILSLKMVVKVPSGMIEADLARPVVDVLDFETNKLEYEIYSYGEETIVVPVTSSSSISPAKKLAMKHIENELKRYADDVKVEFISDNSINIFVPEDDIARIIGREGKTIDEIEKRLGLSISVNALKNEEYGNDVDFTIKDDKKNLIFYMNNKLSNKRVDFYIDNERIFSANVGHKGEIKINKKSFPGKTLLDMIDKGKQVKLKI
ncbi:Flp pilus assembly complex ATPase component TadA [Candidatus Woesearchaeota archaeon]|nr:Flp pilus assembly complex ATPase component TadA [Candidatus Woesearchaeota archaeon]